MSKIKLKRNRQILAAFRKGKTIYEIAKLNKISWTRTKKIIQEQELREG